MIAPAAQSNSIPMLMRVETREKIYKASITAVAISIIMLFASLAIAPFSLPYMFVTQGVAFAISIGSATGMEFFAPAKISQKSSQFFHPAQPLTMKKTARIGSALLVHTDQLNINRLLLNSDGLFADGKAVEISKEILTHFSQQLPNGFEWKVEHQEYTPIDVTNIWSNVASHLEKEELGILSQCSAGLKDAADLYLHEVRINLEQSNEAHITLCGMGKYLKKLSIDNTSESEVDYTLLQLLPDYCPRLEELSFSDPWGDNNQINDFNSKLWNTLLQLRHLKKLTLFLYCSGTEVVFTHVASIFPKLSISIITHS